ncbi:metalloregulator ArsR/SmtB family transcription factor [Nocardia jejuensis]|uniref:metalloregulator ArsR/SmtB family transcription factor n=1 Tax=Nocardia jejuensis TaxID=328049 RepID=UPI00082A0ACF|nr:metalloregulator ArsR/SmtB family transcription factor [Nocardia jejuensis]
MDGIASALGDGARWHIVQLLAERPRSVGELAELTGLRQPQTTKHLQTLAKAGLVTVFPLGQRRVYAIECEPLLRFAHRLQQLVDSAESHSAERDALTRYRASIESDSAHAAADRWADGRTFSFERLVAVRPETVWHYWTDSTLLETWWAPTSMTITDCVIEPKAGGRAVLDYRDADGRRYRSTGQVRTAKQPEHLVFDLSVLDATGAVSFTGRYDLTLTAVPEGTRMRLDLTITETTPEAVPFIAGIEIGWGQVLDNLTRIIDTSSHIH